MQVPVLGPAVPRRGNRFWRATGRWGLSALGWRFEAELPDTPKFVIVVAPHTSAWDFVIGILAMVALGLRASWIGKHSLFRWPFGGVLRWLGGIPVDRSAPHGVVQAMVDRFERGRQLVLGVAPEGTRKGRGEWRTGFYHIAHGARVPIVPCFLDYGRRVVGTGAALLPSGDLDGDLAALQSAYAGVRSHAQVKLAR